ncbi:MAG: hypothetical protein PHZ11_06455 [Desulfitobacteriaceae bacterium]|nr:hypothetical protein [Desulfitobacteriaceae bacterium]MDD4346515.1 hypothetical protein [Desulfitobacteriaceae bacterium]MDD4402066.1 hypothetical protein [Desulfitobacteriaceae bacterium]
MVISIIVPIVFLALVGLLIAGVKGDSKIGGEAMIKKVYLYLVVFTTLMMTIGGGVAAFMAIADMVAPTGYYQTFEDYKQISREKLDPESKNLTEDQIKERYDMMVAGEKERQSDRATNSLIKSLGWIIIPFPIFIYFQRKLRVKEA